MVKERMAVKEPELKKVFICSPFRPRGSTKEAREKDWNRNVAIAQRACRHAVDRGYVPYAPHLYFPHFLSEADPDEREMGIILGLTWLARCDEIWVVGDRISEGMKREISQAREWSIPTRHIVVKRTGEDLLPVLFIDDIF